MNLNIPNCLNMIVAPRRWFVLRLRTNYNLRLQAGAADIAFNSLREMGYDVYLPRRRLDKFNRRKRVLAEWSEPLMPGYLFLVHPRPGQAFDDWSEVRSLEEVIGPLSDDGRPLLLAHGVVEALINSEFSSTYDDTEAGKRFRGENGSRRLRERFRTGRQFVVNDGPFASFLATVDAMTRDEKVRVLVDILGRMVPMTLDPTKLDDTGRPDAA